MPVIEANGFPTRSRRLRRRIIQDFKLEKIACVTKPAQEGALVTIIKRRRNDDDDIDTWSDTARNRKKVQRASEDDDEDYEDIGKSLLGVVLGTAAGAAVHHYLQRKVQDDDDADESNEDFEKRVTVEHPFMQEARALAHAKKIPLYHAMSLHRRAKPQSYRHFLQSGVHTTRGRLMKSAAPASDATRRFESITKAIKQQRGCTGTEALHYAAVTYPELFQKYRAGR
jgi:hypothetical protein